MSVNGTVLTKLCCSQCHDVILQCNSCKEYFSGLDFISCGDDGNHICEQCYEDFGPKAYSEDL